MKFESGVSRYIVGEATVRVFFPVDSRGNAKIACEVCRFYSTSSRRCNLTGEVPEYPMLHVGSACPLERVENDG